MKGDPLTEDQVKRMLVNPYYAINFAENIDDPHEPLVSEEVWIKSNLKLIDELGAEQWLKLLLSVLQSPE